MANYEPNGTYRRHFGSKEIVYCLKTDLADAPVVTICGKYERDESN